ncbi:MAG TPA: hypothetical protein VN256_22945 [Pyrinomonadaceae bacterium]|nr:hypothetical protein [Pyrinomonadaceae bacterium]
MPAKRQRATAAALALLLVISALHLSAGTARAAFPADLAARLQGTLTGQLFTRGNQPVLVNGVQTNSGATILSGAMIQTPDLVGATVVLGLLGHLDIAPNTKLTIEFGSDGKVKVTLVEGCVALRINRGYYGAVNNENGERLTSNDPAKMEEARLDVCLPKGAPAPIVNQGAATNAGAGAEVGGVAGGGGGLPDAFWWWLAGGGSTAAAIITIAARGEDPSESS